MIALTTSATYEGKPLRVLSGLIEQRRRLLGESAQDAVVATGITVLQSLRALTKVAPKRIPKADVRFGRSDPQYLTNRRGETRRRVVVSRYRDGEKKNIIRWQKLDASAGKRPRATAKDLSAAWRRFGAISNRGLARHALGVAMSKIGTRLPASAVSGRVSRLAAANVSVRKSGGADAFALEIRDALGYAALALKGGPSSVGVALMKAANRTAGRLAKVAEAKLGEAIPTPFPEVSRRRVRQ